MKWIALEEGRHIMAASHKGGRNFIVEMYSVDGEDWELLVNEIADYQGEKLINVGTGFSDLSPGIYAVSITADGDWTIDIE